MTPPTPHVLLGNMSLDLNILRAVHDDVVGCFSFFFEKEPAVFRKF